MPPWGMLNESLSSAGKPSEDGNRSRSPLGNLAPVEFERRGQENRITESKIRNL